VHRSATSPAVLATDVTHRQGQGVTAVDALSGVSLEVLAGVLVVVMARQVLGSRRCCISLSGWTSRRRAGARQLSYRTEVAAERP
jgi:hypothetical protein